MDPNAALELSKYKEKVLKVIIAELGANSDDAAILLRSLDLKPMIPIPTKVGARLLLNDGRKVILTKYSSSAGADPWASYDGPDDLDSWLLGEDEIQKVGIERILSEGDDE